MKLYGTPFLLLLFMLLSCGQKYGANLPFNSQQASNDSATLFADRIISTHLNEYNITFHQTEMWCYLHCKYHYRKQVLHNFHYKKGRRQMDKT